MKRPPPRRPATPGGTWREWDALFNSISDGVMLTDLAGRILQANRAMERLVNAKSGTLAGDTIWRVLHDAPRRPRGSPLSTMRKTRSRVSVLHTRGDRLLGLRVDPFLDARGLLTGAVFFVSDITERIRANEAIREAKDRFQALLDASAAAIVTMDERSIVQTWNPAAERMFGWTAAEAVGKRHPAITEEDMPAHVRRRSRVLKGGTLRDIETRWQRKDGTTADIRLSSAPLHGAGGRIAGLVQVVEDVTDLKRAEAVLRQRELEIVRLQKMDAMGRLAGGMAHNFNNILTAIVGYSDLLAAQLEPGSAAQGHAAAVLEAGRRAAELCRNLLRFSRSQVLDMTLLDLNALVVATKDLLQPLLSDDVDLLVVLRPGVWRVRGNGNEIQQIILSMAINAREAMPRGGRLVIETMNVELDEHYTRRHPGRAPGRYVLLAVSDTGAGLSEEARAHLFEPFFSTKPDGNGLGLSTAYGFVRQLEGHIDVYSESGKGTTFKVYLPRAPEEAPGPMTEPAPAPAPARGGRETVLVVEDRPEILDLTKNLLAAEGYRVLIAGNGTEGARVVRSWRGPLDALLTDLILPGLNGRELASEAAALRPGLKTLYMSGYTDTVLVRQGLLEPKLPFLQKPFTREELLRRLREVLDSRGLDLSSKG